MLIAGTAEGMGRRDDVNRRPVRGQYQGARG